MVLLQILFFLKTVKVTANNSHILVNFSILQMKLSEIIKPFKTSFFFLFSPLCNFYYVHVERHQAVTMDLATSRSTTDAQRPYRFIIHKYRALNEYSPVLEHESQLGHLGLAYNSGEPIYSLVGLLRNCLFWIVDARWYPNNSVSLKLFQWGLKLRCVRWKTTRAVEGRWLLIMNEEASAVTDKGGRDVPFCL